jgi:hypothetical protein
MDLGEFEANSTAIAERERAFLTKKYVKSAVQAGVAELISVSLTLR